MKLILLRMNSYEKIKGEPLDIYFEVFNDIKEIIHLDMK